MLLPTNRNAQKYLQMKKPTTWLPEMKMSSLVHTFGLGWADFGISNNESIQFQTNPNIPIYVS